MVTYWVLIPIENERSVRMSKVVKRIRCPYNAHSEGYPMTFECRTKKEAIQRFNEIGIDNEYRPLGYKTYDLRSYIPRGLMV